MRRPLPLLFLLILSGLVLGCTIQTGLTRTSYDSFETVSFKSFGIQIILPEKGKDWRSNYYKKIYDTEAYKRNTNSEEVVLFLHPYWFSSIMTEPEYFLILRIVKAKADAKLIDVYGRYERVGDLSGIDPGYKSKDIDEWMGLDRYSGREYLIFEREVDLPKNEKIYASAKLFHRPDINKREDLDILTIKKILKSVSPIK